ncbi:FAD-dependent monooxygenase [Nostoc linckia FACHB-391]|uniref:FAD-dependent monooxygenase n=2 Tax=Nostoc TaxID=1177 RepID=A0ABR8IK14_9NOSO|nr:FAD-dependent monooxygenase [Nostoc linckia FACHB-391]MBD2651892.1 FAD-dependent monooxygenase [Nostoc foliaceum FACHB-393]
MNNLLAKNDTNILVIGAGVSGLTTAICLREAGFNVVRTYATGTNSGRGVALPHDNLNQTKHIGILGRFSC